VKAVSRVERGGDEWAEVEKKYSKYFTKERGQKKNKSRSDRSHCQSPSKPLKEGRTGLPGEKKKKRGKEIYDSLKRGPAVWNGRTGM